MTTTATSESQSQPATILIIDDTPTNLGVVVDHLEDHGFRVAVARNGKEGIKRAKFVQPELILLDVMMPDMDGFETCRRLKASEATRDIPVIFMTALEETTDKVTGFEAGGVDYITKPFQIAEVLARVTTHLSLRAMQVQLADQNVQLHQEIVVRQHAETALQHARNDLEVRVAERTVDLERANARLESEIVERKQAEQALQQARDGLEVSVQERTAELSKAYASLVAEIEERKQAEAALRLRNRAIESSVNAIVITNCTKPDNPIEYVNPAFERITGYMPEDALGRNISFLLSDDKDQPEVEDIQAALRQQREGSATLRNYRKDGSLFWNELHLAPVRDEKGHVTHFVFIMNDITEAKNRQEELKHHASYDVLTGLPNRTLLLDRLTQAIALAQRPNYTVAVAFIDLDRFKNINDTLGHASGDELLMSIARRLKSCVRKSDTVARLGGDEFVVILSDQNNPATSMKTELRLEGSGSSHPPIIGVLNRMLDAVTEPVVLNEREVSVSCSIGVSFFPHDGQSAETLLKNADAAMYRAKEKGRNDFQFYTAEMNLRIAEQLSMESLLRRALERNEFTLHYQPKVDLGNGGISGVEALLRWNSPEKGIVPPLTFIPILERIGKITDVGKWVIRQALAEQVRWQDAGLPIPRLAVNVSQIQLDQRNFVAMVKEALDMTDSKPSRLDLEITESMIMKNADTNFSKLKAIREIGIGVAIDDFGTGYTSLTQLGNLPVTLLKIDRAFIANLTNNPSDRNLVSTVIALAHSLKLKVVAEGVETTAQMELLAQLECDEIQGYLISKPLAIEQYLEWQKGFSFKPKELLKITTL